MATAVTVAAQVAPKPAADVAECIHAAVPVLASIELDGAQTATLSPGTVTIGDRRLTRCEGLPKAHPSAIAATSGGLAIGFRDGGVWVLESDGKGESGTWLEGLPQSPVRGLASDGTRLWIATATAGLFSASGGKAVRSEHRVLGRRGITAVALDSSGSLHVGIDPIGHYVVDSKGAVRKRARAAIGCFTSPDATPRSPGSNCHESAAEAGSLPTDHITALAVHRGELLVGFFDRGIAVESGKKFEPIESAPRFVNAMVSVGETLYVATPKGLFRKRGDMPFRRMRLALPSEHVNGLFAASDGTLWIATGAGLARWRGGAVSIVGEKAGLPSRIVYAVTAGGDGAIWAGTAAGLARISGEAVTVFDQTKGDLRHDWITSLVPDKTGVLVGTYDAGVARCSSAGCAPEKIFDAAWINPHGLFRMSGGQIAAATLGDGLIISDLGSSNRAAVPTLPSDDVTAIVVFEGRRWVGTRGGLAVF